MIKNDFYLTTLELSDSNSWIMTHNGGPLLSIMNNELCDPNTAYVP